MQDSVGRLVGVTILNRITRLPLSYKPHDLDVLRLDREIKAESRHNSRWY